VLDTETKGTGAHMVPLEKKLEQPAPARRRTRRPPKRQTAAPRRKRKTVETTRGPLPPGHVRKTATGEIGRVVSVDPKDGTATVEWLRGGHTSTVPLSAISRR
jgi:hypothetical protein